MRLQRSSRTAMHRGTADGRSAAQDEGSRGAVMTQRAAAATAFIAAAARRRRPRPRWPAAAERRRAAPARLRDAAAEIRRGTQRQFAAPPQAPAKERRRDVSSAALSREQEKALVFAALPPQRRITDISLTLDTFTPIHYAASRIKYCRITLLLRRRLKSPECRRRNTDATLFLAAPSLMPQRRYARLIAFSLYYGPHGVLFIRQYHALRAAFHGSSHAQRAPEIAPPPATPPSFIAFPLRPRLRRF